MNKYLNYKPGKVPEPSQHTSCFTAKYALVLLLVTFFSTAIKAQPNITRVEYYVDADPGYGSGKSISIVPGNDLDSISFNVSLAPFATGVHALGLGSRDANGAWSLDNKWLFLKPYAKEVAAAKTNITRVEYYLDTDPGYGNATPLSIVPANSLTNLAINIDLTSLYAGVHLVGIRSQDNNGAWSIDNRWIFLNPYANGGAAVLPNITRVEYYVDTDPGYGNGTSLPIVPANNFTTLSANIDLIPLTDGVHVVGVRSQDANGAWSLDNHWVFLKRYNAGKTAALPKIGRVEYYVDTDPGYGNATALSFNPANNLNNLSINLNITTLAQGVHIVGIRSLDSNGAWGLDAHWTFLKPFNAGDTTVQPNIVKVEYYVDADPGYENATPIAIVPGQDLADLSFPINISSLFIGQHNIGVRSKDINGAWSLDNRYTITITSHAGLLSNAVTDVSKQQQESLKNTLRLQYNPVHQQAVLLYTSTKNDKTVIRVFDNLGKVVLSKEASVFTGVNIITLETATLAQGIYTIQSVSTKDSQTVRMMKE